MKTILLLAVVIALLSCEMPKEPITNPEKVEYHSVQLLFEKDGCKVYRFSDEGNVVYFTNCAGKTEYERTVHQGKMVTHERVQNESFE